MKKNTKTIGLLFSVALLSVSLFSSCNSKSENADKSVSDENKLAASKVSDATSIAYVEVDSLMTQYLFSKEFTLSLTKKGERIKSTLTAKGQALQKAAEDFQRKVQTGAYTKEQAQNVQLSLQKQQIELQNLQEKLGKEFDNEQQKFNSALRDSIQTFLKAYNKTHHFSLILSKAGDNILYADKKHDITADVVNGLNKRYQASKKSAQ